MRRLVAALAVVQIALLSGCARKAAPERLPPYRWTDEHTALADLRARAQAVETLSARCGITLTRPDGQGVQLDGALVMQRPGRVRLRTWKFNRAVFDLTLNEDGLWVMTLDDPKRREQVIPASVRAADFVRELSLFTGGFFTDEPPPRTELRGNALRLARDTAQGTLHCEVDRATLTPRRFYARDESGERFELKMSQYCVINGIPWATRMEASSTMGRVVVEQHDVEINGELAPGAFVPPARAEKRQ